MAAVMTAVKTRQGSRHGIESKGPEQQCNKGSWYKSAGAGVNKSIVASSGNTLLFVGFVDGGGTRKARQASSEDTIQSNLNASQVQSRKQAKYKVKDIHACLAGHYWNRFPPQTCPGYSGHWSIPHTPTHWASGRRNWHTHVQQMMQGKYCNSSNVGPKTNLEQT